MIIFVTGGVVSSLGKGLTTAALGALIKSAGFSVRPIKVDPYLNVDAGTMNPFQHGEVFVTDDGSETDLDLGHYERFFDFQASADNVATAGHVYSTVLSNERQGLYDGATVQVIPHITDEIKRRILTVANSCDMTFIEVGGTAGDIESQPVLEALRQLRLSREHESLHIHMTLVPELSTTGELKTKPTQHSVRDLRTAGIQPDMILCRSNSEISQELLDKIGLFCSVDPKRVFSVLDVPDVYQLPSSLHATGIDRAVMDFFELDYQPQPQEWEHMATLTKSQNDSVTIALVGKYTELADAYKSLNEALRCSAMHSGRNIDWQYINSDELPADQQACAEVLQQADGIVVPGGFGVRGTEGMISAVRYARENKVPFLGICLGLQIAVIEAARNLLGHSDAHSTEMNSQTAAPVVALVEEFIDGAGQKQERGFNEQRGGSLRTGGYDCKLNEQSHTGKAYNDSVCRERHRHRFEVNERYVEQLQQAGLVVVGRSTTDDALVEVMEYADHPWFVGCQFHPELTASALRGHPLFNAFIDHAITHRTHSHDR